MLSHRRHSLCGVCKETGEVRRVVRRPYHREAYSTVFTGESKTHASHHDACDINKIVAQYHRTNTLPAGKKPGVFADVTHLQEDLTNAINKSRETISRAQDNGRKIDAARKEQAKADAAAKREAEANSAASPAVTSAAAAAPKSDAK